MRQQIVTFEEMYDHVKEDGLFVCEDLHTSYWRKYGGGYKRKSSFIEYSKNFIDQLHALYPVKGTLKANKIAETTHSLHYYSGILVMEKRIITSPVDSMTGTPAVKQQPEQKRSLVKRIFGKP